MVVDFDPDPPVQALARGRTQAFAELNGRRNAESTQRTAASFHRKGPPRSPWPTSPLDKAPEPVLMVPKAERTFGVFDQRKAGWRVPSTATEPLASN